MTIITMSAITEGVASLTVQQGKSLLRLQTIWVEFGMWDVILGDWASGLVQNMSHQVVMLEHEHDDLKSVTIFTFVKDTMLSMC
jgi:hypothetical protein